MPDVLSNLAMLLLLACAEAPASPLPPSPPPPEPDPVCDVVHPPFPVADRRSWAALKSRIGSHFGDARTSYVPGHLHAGLDLGTTFGEAVHAICAGVVEDVQLAYPHLTVVVRHAMPDGTTRWSSYKHVSDVTVAVGDRVDATTRLARVFDATEQKGAPWKQNHLHFEWRTSFDDAGTASWTSMSKEELTRYCADPATFLAGAMR